MFKKKSWAKKPAEATKPRTKEEINKEYSDLCSKAGELQFQVFAIKSQLDSINQRIISLGQEADRAEKETPKTEGTTSGSEAAPSST